MFEQMTKKDIDSLVKKYEREKLGSNEDWLSHSTQYDDRSARINYSFIRECKPKVVVEFGANTGRCTHDILRALLRNKKRFSFCSYEIDDKLRNIAQEELNRIFRKEAIKIGGDIVKATDIPDRIEYLFIDGNHDAKTTRWILDFLIKKCVKGALIQIHDIRLIGNWKAIGEKLGETKILIKYHRQGRLPIQKLYWSYEFEPPIESSWWKVI